MVTLLFPQFLGTRKKNLLNYWDYILPLAKVQLWFIHRLIVLSILGVLTLAQLNSWKGHRFSLTFLYSGLPKCLLEFSPKYSLINCQLCK